MSKLPSDNDWYGVVDRDGVVIPETLAGTRLKAIRKAAAEVFDTTWPTLRKEDGMRVARVRLIALEPK